MSNLDQPRPPWPFREAAELPKAKSEILEILEEAIEVVEDMDFRDFTHAEWQAAMRLFKHLKRHRTAYTDEHQRRTTSVNGPIDPHSASGMRKVAQRAFRHLPWKGDLAPRGDDGLVSVVAKSFLNRASVIIYADTVERAREIVDLIEPHISAERRDDFHA
jgi:hypothetical protein